MRQWLLHNRRAGDKFTAIRMAAQMKAKEVARQEKEKEKSLCKR
jgi:hypothetical protein